MFKLRIGYVLAGIATGLILVFHFIWSLPDGKLHMTFCNVGQGDATYIRFPDGRDMVIDGGPNDMVLQCLGKHMPFWDRTLDLVVLSHPEKDHLQGLVSVLDRYRVGALVRSNVSNTSEGFANLMALVKQKHIPERLVTTGERVSIGKATLAVVWPSAEQIAMMKPVSVDASVLGAQSAIQKNDGSIVFWLHYGSFDALFPGDADTHVEPQYIGSGLADGSVEVLKVPHHGSKTGMNADFLDWLKPQLAVISVGKNSFGHPAPETLQQLADHQSRVLRTDQIGDITIVSDGKNWKVE